MPKIYFHRWPSLLVLLCFLHSTVFAQVVQVWVSRYNGLDNLIDSVHCLALDGNGNVYVAGQTTTSTTQGDFVTVKYGPNGNVIWVSRFNSTFNLNDAATSIAVDASGNVYVAGWSNFSANSSAFTTVKYDPNGLQLWAHHYQGPVSLSNKATSLGLDGSGNVYITGGSAGAGSGDDIAAISYDAGGNVRWVTRYNGFENSHDYPNSIAVTASGNAYIAGRTIRLPGNQDYVTIKLNTIGVVQWVSTYDGLGNSSDEALDIGLDANEDVFVTGETFGAGTDYDVTTIKYEGITGRPLWLSRYNGLQNLKDQGTALDVDKQGDVYVTGFSYNNATFDYLTIKYNGLIGNQQWASRYNGPGNASDRAADIAVDEAGNSYITGASFGAGNEDYATISYDMNGVQRWVQRYNGPANGNDLGNSIEVDLSGNVYVTGQSQGGATSDDIATIKYAQPLPLKVSAGDNTTIYLGYGSSCVNLKAEATDGTPPYSYKWSPGGETAAQTSVCPTATTTYTVTVTDAFGFTASDDVTVTVIDVRCGKNNVMVCHNGQSLCVASNSVAYHLNHGDALGQCVSPGIQSSDPGMAISMLNTPNPFSNITRIQYDVPEDGKVLIKVFDEIGREVSVLVNAERKAGVYSVNFNASAFDKRIFFYRMTLSTKNRLFVKTGKMLRIK